MKAGAALANLDRGGDGTAWHRRGDVAQAQRLTAANRATAAAETAVATDRVLAVLDAEGRRHVDAGDGHTVRLHDACQGHTGLRGKTERFRIGIGASGGAGECATALANGQRAGDTGAGRCCRTVPHADALIVADAAGGAGEIAAATDGVLATADANAGRFAKSADGDAGRGNQAVQIHIALAREGKRIRVGIAARHRAEAEATVAEFQRGHGFAAVVIGAGMAQAQSGAGGNGARCGGEVAVAVDRVSAVADVDCDRHINAADCDGIRLHKGIECDTGLAGKRHRIGVAVVVVTIKCGAVNTAPMSAGNQRVAVHPGQLIDRDIGWAIMRQPPAGAGVFAGKDADFGANENTLAVIRFDRNAADRRRWQAAGDR